MISQARMADQILKEAHGSFRTSSGLTRKFRNPEMVRRREQCPSDEVGGCGGFQVVDDAGNAIVIFSAFYC